MAAVTAGPGAAASLPVAAWLGPLLVLAGLGAVATEAGRPLRGPRVLARVRTSWMSRELWLGGAFALLAPGALALPGAGPRVLAAAAAVALALAQGQVLRHARGVAAWSVAPMPVVFLTSALVSGAGLLLLLEAGAGRPPERLLGAALVALVAHLGAWSLYLTWSRDAAFVDGVRPLREGATGAVTSGAGVLLPALLAALAIAAPPLGRALAVTAGVVMIAGQAWMKAALIRPGGQLRPITLPVERLHRRVP